MKHFIITMTLILLMVGSVWGETYKIDCGDGSGFYYEANSPKEINHLKAMLLKYPGWSVIDLEKPIGAKNCVRGKGNGGYKKP